MAMRKVRDRRDIYPVFRELFERKRHVGGGAMKSKPAENRLLFEGADWDFDTLARIYDGVAAIGLGELGLDIYRPRIEVITTEQMLDAYASTGMPLFYRHWSFGKQFVRNETLYRKGWQGLAYEIVINSNPCVVYLLEENTATMQTLVLAHAAFGHNHFFKNNYVFKQWTDADGILDYLAFAKNYIAECEDRYGPAEVERVLDAAHALQNQGIHRYPGKTAIDLRSEEKRERERREHGERLFNDLWRTVPEQSKKAKKRRPGTRTPPRAARPAGGKRPLLPRKDRAAAQALAARGNSHRPAHRAIFLSAAPDQDDERGLRDLYVHYEIMQRLLDKGQITEGSYLGVPAFAHQCGGAARLRRPALLWAQPLRARLCDDEGYRAHLRQPAKRGPAMVPGYRRQ